MYGLLRPLLFCLPSEMAHHVAMSALKRSLYTRQKLAPDPCLSQRFWGMNFTHPLGLSAGLDKNAEAAKGLLDQGFAFIETGTVTPKPQAGNPKPRLFRLKEDQALINRLGFNNQGIERYLAHLARWEQQRPARQAHAILGCNIGKNKTTEQALVDYLTLLPRVYPHGSYITINISSPNTPGLRTLQQREHLLPLLKEMTTLREQLQQKHQRFVPLWVKIDPDGEENHYQTLADTILEAKCDAIVVSNTTVARQGLKSAQQEEAGGLSGAPLFERSTQVLAQIYRHTSGAIPLVGVGGIGNPAQAYAKIRAGASLLQLYTAFIYQGPAVIKQIVETLPALLEKDGYSHISEAIGADA